MVVRGAAALLAAQFGGEVLARGLGLPVPGPVIGIVLVLAVLAAAARVGADPARLETAIGPTADTLLAHLGLLFVPAGVGVAQHLGLIAAHGTGIVIALVGSTVATLTVTVLVFRLVARRLDAATSAEDGERQP